MRHVALAMTLVAALAACDRIGAGLAPDDAGGAEVATVGTDDFGGLLNSARAEAGLPGAAADPRLTAAAQRFAEDMVARDYFSHTEPDGTGLSGRLATAGVSQCGAAENIALGATSPGAAHAMWMDSPPHRANLLFSGNVAYGFGLAGGKAVLILARAC